MVGRVRCPLPVAETSDGGRVGGGGDGMDRFAPEEEKGKRGRPGRERGNLSSIPARATTTSLVVTTNHPLLLAAARLLIATLVTSLAT